jgi:hypothetical protein
MTNLTPVKAALANHTLRVGDHLSLYSKPIAHGIVAAIHDQAIQVFWLDNQRTQPVSERILSRLLYGRTRTDFNNLMTWWYAETKLMSSVDDIMAHPAADLIGEANPLWLIGELIRLLGHQDVQTLGMLALLHRLTGEQPFPDEDRGDVEAMIEAWEQWSHTKKTSSIIKKFKQLLGQESTEVDAKD